jgi:hypothetical protein
MGNKLKISDRETILEITYEDMIKYHGRYNIAGVALAFKVMELAFPRLAEGNIPAREEISFFSGIGSAGMGVIDGVEMVTRARTRGRLIADDAAAKGKPAPDAPEGGKYYFEVSYKSKKIGLALKEGLIPDEFMILSRKAFKSSISKEEARRLQAVKEQIAAAVMSNEAADIFDCVLTENIAV